MNGRTEARHRMNGRTEACHMHGRTKTRHMHGRIQVGGDVAMPAHSHE